MISRGRIAGVDELIELVHHRWNIPVIAVLYRGSGAKFVALVNQLAVSRASLSVSLEHLIALGLVRRNTGHGHPMRPEYLLTKRGAAVGIHCASLMQIVQRKNDAELAFRKWTLPLVATIGVHRLRFRDLRNSLGDATPRAVAIGLKSLLREQWVARTLIDEFPPAAGYALKPKGRRILTSVDRLCG